LLRHAVVDADPVEGAQRVGRQRDEAAVKGRLVAEIKDLA
jgi:hypothetical protein